MGTARTCERCGTPIRTGSPEGLCTECMLRDGLSVSGEAPFEADPDEAGRLWTDSSATAAEAQAFGDYELLEKVAQGGMGIVYRARQRSIDRIVALKELALGSEAGPEAIKRFQAEVRAIARFQHPNIVTVLDVGCFEGRHFFTMDFVSGPTLSAMAQGKPLPAKRAACYVRTIAGAIHYAHEQGIIHRNPLASGGWTPDIWRRSIPDGKPLGAPLRGHHLNVAQLAFSPDGKTLASSGLDRTIRWWDMAMGQELLLIPEAILASGTEYRFRINGWSGGRPRGRSESPRFLH